MSKQELHVVLGAGQVGPLVAERLMARGHRVRVVRKSAAPARVAGLETVTADVRDAAQVAKAAEGASVVYHCVNPLYDQWPAMLLPMTRGIVEGAARAGARLVALDNLYMYGKTERMTEDTPVSPVSKKGALRVQAAEIMLEADAKGTVPVAVGRAADFFGPHQRLSILGEYFLRDIVQGKTARLWGDADQPHSYSYTPDVADGLVALGTSGERGLWMLPVQPAQTTRAVVGRFAAALGRPIAIGSIPVWLLRAVGVVWPMATEVAEMAYQWQQPFALEDRKFRTRFGAGATAWDEAIGATTAWAVQAYGKGPRDAPRRAPQPSP
ncbi:MAG TPA: NAD-dependent epimerase/dehydratase family protein [Polyangiaceae bacterium]|jgi:nucleoside-diphosphate-sugar epimerase|nr:NAD-dependent epimerase/dehydratase family protein [Polyangiaceae bacterium]